MALKVVTALEARKAKAISLRLPLPSQNSLPILYVTLFIILTLAGMLFIRIYARFFDKGSLEGSTDLISVLVFITVTLISWTGYQKLIRHRH
ncbi:MAG: hypothetical protein AB2L14_22910 [Candidatus Xenobiia bacterium LiM19]